MPAGHLHAHEDRRRLLAHVDALQAQIDAERGTVGSFKATLRSENARLTSERDAARAEVERMRAVLEDIRSGDHVGLTQPCDPAEGPCGECIIDAALAIGGAR